MVRAEHILGKWKTQLGDGIYDVQQDLFGPGGRLEGMQGYQVAIGERDFGVCQSIRLVTLPIFCDFARWLLTEPQQIADRKWFASCKVQNLLPFEIGHAGFEVGSYVPAAHSNFTL